jgi:cytochrome c
MNTRSIGISIALLLSVTRGTIAQERASMAAPELAKSAECLKCHNGEKDAVAPTFAAVAARYKGDEKARERLIAVVRKGGRGNWVRMSHGIPMPPYSPRLTDEEINRLVSWILAPQTEKQ